MLVFLCSFMGSLKSIMSFSIMNMPWECFVYNKSEVEILIYGYSQTATIMAINILTYSNRTKLDVISK